VVQLGPSDALVRVTDGLAESLGTPMECYAAEYHHMLALHDPDNVWGETKAILSAYPVKAGATVVQTKLEDLVRIARDGLPKASATRNLFSATALRVDALDAYLRILFALNHQYYKRLIDVSALFPRLNRKPVESGTTLNRLAEAGSCREAQEHLLTLIEGVLPLVGEVYPSADIEWSLRRLGSVPACQEAS